MSHVLCIHLLAMSMVTPWLLVGGGACLRNTFVMCYCLCIPCASNPSPSFVDFCAHAHFSKKCSSLKGKSWGCLSYCWICSLLLTHINYLSKVTNITVLHHLLTFVHMLTSLRSVPLWRAKLGLLILLFDLLRVIDPHWLFVQGDGYNAYPSFVDVCAHAHFPNKCSSMKGKVEVAYPIVGSAPCYWPTLTICLRWQI